jgi:hypothetical protein
MMLSTTNPTRLPGVKRPTQPLLTTSTGSQMMEEDSPQLLHQLLLSKNGFHSMITNQLSLNMSKEMMLGQTIKQTNQMKLNGKLTFLPLVLIILTQLRPPQRPLLQMLTHLLLWFKRTALLIQWKIATLTSIHTTKETMLGMKPSTTTAMRSNGAERLTRLLLIIPMLW